EALERKKTESLMNAIVETGFWSNDSRGARVQLMFPAIYKLSCAMNNCTFIISSWTHDKATIDYWATYPTVNLKNMARNDEWEVLGFEFERIECPFLHVQVDIHSLRPLVLYPKIGKAETIAGNAPETKRCYAVFCPQQVRVKEKERQSFILKKSHHARSVKRHKMSRRKLSRHTLSCPTVVKEHPILIHVYGVKY
ncbi:hypothetical protein TELCIR_14738, partial [Teladorsagia circumcincta]